MPSMKFIAFAMVFVGVIVNNYAYLHDVIVGSYLQDGERWVLLGTKTYIVAGITFAAVIVGSAILLMRSNGK